MGTNCCLIAECGGKRRSAVEREDAVPRMAKERGAPGSGTTLFGVILS